MSRKLSRYIVETQKDGDDALFDTIQKKFLPIDASEKVLSENNFLQGQEDRAINAWLLSPPRYLYLVVVPTWKCNLKCTHCCVQERLKHPDEPEPEFNVPQLMDFIARHGRAYSAPRTGMLFCGGEPLLKPEKMGEVIDSIQAEYPEIKFNVTTNLAMPLTDRHIEVLRKLSSITISIDGNETEHNAQRVPVVPLDNPYQRSVENIQQLMLSGFQKKMNVQGCVANFDEEPVLEYFKTMLGLGFPEDRIKYATHTPCEACPQKTEEYLGYMAYRPQYRECCKYRYMQNFLVDNTGNIFSDFYCYEKVGLITDPIAAIAEKYQETIQEMPVLNDPKCRKCSSLGYCWGGCANNNYLYKTDGPPSKYCKPKAKIEFIKIGAANGHLLGTPAECTQQPKKNC